MPLKSRSVHTICLHTETTEAKSKQEKPTKVRDGHKVALGPATACSLLPCHADQEIGQDAAGFCLAGGGAAADRRVRLFRAGDDRARRRSGSFAVAPAAWTRPPGQGAAGGLPEDRHVRRQIGLHGSVNAGNDDSQGFRRLDAFLLNVAPRGSAGGVVRRSGGSRMGAGNDAGGRLGDRRQCEKAAV